MEPAQLGTDILQDDEDQKSNKAGQGINPPDQLDFKIHTH
jgi:hypothetical protein